MIFSIGLCLIFIGYAIRVFTEPTDIHEIVREIYGKPNMCRVVAGLFILIGVSMLVISVVIAAWRYLP